MFGDLRPWISKSGRIGILNDYLRKTFTGGRIVMTASIAELDQQRKVRVLLAVRAFNEFDADNDPHHEHDVAFFAVDGERYFFKVDYYDLSTGFHSPDPADPNAPAAYSQSAITPTTEAIMPRTVRRSGYPAQQLDVLRAIMQDPNFGPGPSPEPIVADPWIVSSLLQKSVRRGEIEIAQRASLTLFRSRGSAIWRRFLVIAFEDVGIGSIEAVTMTVAAGSDAACPKGVRRRSSCSRSSRWHIGTSAERPIRRSSCRGKGSSRSRRICSGDGDCRRWG